MTLGAFSVSLAVKNIVHSRKFYEKLGFEVFGGNEEEKWLMLRCGEHVIGLFQGMFEGNILTFNPGWNQSGENIESFSDIRELEKEFKKRGITIDSGIENNSGPASFMLKDPDGNVLLFDQHR